MSALRHGRARPSGAGGLAALTGGQFIALWTERVNRFMARKVEPPTRYVQHASKAKKLTRLAATDKKKTKVRRESEHQPTNCRCLLRQPKADIQSEHRKAA
jgi:hypothetical protein